MNNREIVNLDFCIIGAGIVGLSICHLLQKKYPTMSMALIEKEKYLGEHTSGRNSGVLHAGLYYAHNSLKHRLCIEGNEVWDSWAKELEIPIKRCGKWILASNDNEAEALQEVFAIATQNQVPGIRMGKQSEINELKEICFVHSGFYSPRTGIIDQSTALTKLRDSLQTKDIPVIMETEVNNVAHQNSHYFDLECADFNIHTRVLINAAGLSAVKLRKLMGLNDLNDYWVKGAYLKSNQSAITKNLIYPVPLKNLKGLGVHLTLDFQNQMKFGPNAFDVETLDYSTEGLNKLEMLSAVKKLFKTIDCNKLEWDYSGIRPKLKNSNGELVKDFIIQTPINNYWEFLGIESPGFTAAPALANFLLNKL